jgi:hypothetical protein
MRCPHKKSWIWSNNIGSIPWLLLPLHSQLCSQSLGNYNLKNVSCLIRRVWSLTCEYLAVIVMSLCLNSSFTVIISQLLCMHLPIQDRSDHFRDSAVSPATSIMLLATGFLGHSSTPYGLCFQHLADHGLDLLCGCYRTKRGPDQRSAYPLFSWQNQLLLVLFVRYSFCRSPSIVLSHAPAIIAQWSTPS